MGVTANAVGATSHVDIDKTIEMVNVMKVRISMGGRGDWGTRGLGDWGTGTLGGDYVRDLQSDIP